ncbi:MAG: type II toxin-antitoxin system PemK/MazF family toxin [Ancrocorticia sp.]|jgi:hypothetical protein|nr:type II toxin-antitoxin system PemK/MazF family toxin [Ancrocorticia sp.]MCI1896633.1 type II toxin-antitoxin system PemK/MazF family toxin [Ancrocorticia sp.]MCI1933246.1 type II toxin-antitoxin system PemK/MazF family toxin [Ancrocorticia sp.]MCI2013435.1 type II toxin-antitoxin system PemK/MazF family toxin [Ancrocorticia sp.]MCI2178813.1 type II toxin-antitoxin system PemK/MazF family toxin [Ancrocorticia sp.]
MMARTGLLHTLLGLLAPPRRRTHTHRRLSATQQPFWHTETEGNPGQYGPGATRDLSADEVRALRPSYAPHPDGDPDPGEVIWTWVPYVENDGRGKDRPVLIIARISQHAVAGCYLSTKQHDGYLSIGSGSWDSKGRESFLNPHRILWISDTGMRREGNVLPKSRFASVKHAIGHAQRLAW